MSPAIGCGAWDFKQYDGLLGDGISQLRSLSTRTRTVSNIPSPSTWRLSSSSFSQLSLLIVCSTQDFLHRNGLASLEAAADNCGTLVPCFDPVSDGVHDSPVDDIFNGHLRDRWLHELLDCTLHPVFIGLLECLLCGSLCFLNLPVRPKGGRDGHSKPRWGLQEILVFSHGADKGLSSFLRRHIR